VTVGLSDVAGITPLSASPLNIHGTISAACAAFRQSSNEVVDTDSAILPIND
jgi:hypothetical protein